MTKRIAALLVVMALAGSAFGQLPEAPKPQDSYQFHRTADVLFGFVIAAPVGVYSDRPWLGLLAGEAAGIANEARYGSHFNTTHLAYISAGALAGYGLAKLAHRANHKK